MKATPIPFSNQREEKLSWGLSLSGEFKLKDAYHIANANDPKSMNQHYNEEWIWKIRALPKIKFFLWQCSHDSIPNHILLANRGMNISPLCPTCNSAPETIIHALRNCPKAQSLWNSFSPLCSAASFYDTQLMVWLRINCKLMHQCNATELDCAIIFPIAVWVLWLHRNNLVFGKSTTQKDLKAETLAKAAKMAYLGIIEKHVKAKTKIQVRWLPPPISWMKLNLDGSSMRNLGLAGRGGLICNENGEWVKGYTRAIGCATSVTTELWALRDGIRSTYLLKFQRLCLNAKLVIDLLKKDAENPNGVGILVADCREGLKKIPLVRIQHCYREANKCADALARRGASLTQDFTIFMKPPSNVAFLLNLDSAGMVYFRDVASVMEGS